MTEPLNQDAVEQLRDTLRALDTMPGLDLAGELTVTYDGDIVGYVQVSDTEATFTQIPRDA